MKIKIIVGITISILITLIFSNKVYALDEQQTITNERMKGDLNLTINYENGKWVKFTTVQQTYGIKLNIESNTGNNTNYTYNNNVKISIIKIGDKVYYLQTTITDNTKNIILYSDSYELIENNNYIKTTGLKIYNGTVPNYGQVRYYDFTNDRFSDTYGGMNNFLGEGILYYSNINYVIFTNDNTPNTDYNNYSKIYNFNLETPVEPEPIDEYPELTTWVNNIKEEITKVIQFIINDDILKGVIAILFITVIIAILYRFIK